MNRFHQAEVKCAAVGKPMRTETEWTLACEGPNTLPFPYGYMRDTNKCLGDVEWDGPNMKKVAQRDPHELGSPKAATRSGVTRDHQPFCRLTGFGVVRDARARAEA